MSVSEMVKMINKASEENRKKMNEQIDKFKTAYIIENSYGDAKIEKFENSDGAPIRAIAMLD